MTAEEKKVIHGDGRVLLLGESNPYGPSPEFALYCDPSGCSGHRLRLILGLPEEAYVALHRKNLCDGEWSIKAAHARAIELLSPQAPWKVIVLLGRKVTETFEKIAFDGEKFVEFSVRQCGSDPFTTRKYCPGTTLVSLPHPSGLNARCWPVKARDRVRQILRELAPEVPWGCLDVKEITA